MTEEERYELELAEQARLNSGDWDSVAPGKASNFRQSFFRMIGLLGPYKWVFALVSLLGAIGVVLAVAAPKVLGEATNVIFEGVVSASLPAQFAGMSQTEVVEALRAAGQTDIANMVAAMQNFQVGAGIDFERLKWVLVAALAIYVASAVLTWIQGYVINIVMVRTMWRLREQVEAKINRLPLSYFDRVQRGELISRVTNDIDNITQTMQQSLSTAVTNVLTVVGVLVMMFSISWQLAIVALVALPLMAVVFGIIGPKSQKAFNTQWRKVGRLNARVEESFSGHALVRVYGREKDSREKFQEENEDLYQAAFKAQFLSGLMMPAMMFIGSLSYVGIAVLGGLMVASGQLRLGDVQAFIQYSQQFTQPLSELGGMAAVVQSGTASAERVFELLDEDEQEPDAEDAPALRGGRGVIEFEHVVFSYAPDKPLIRDLSFRVEPGQTVAIVGPTGAGKTTLVNLLMRFYELDGGRILLDGQDIAELTRDDVRSRTGMVLQDPWLFAGTIRENIAYARPDASDKEINQAARAANASDFIDTFERGLDTEIGERGVKLSGGQKQRLAIARAILKDAPILILDEATSSLDSRAEHQVQQALDRLMKGRTVLIIAHRLSTIASVDTIVTLRRGRIDETGTPKQLASSGGIYQQLLDLQLGATESAKKQLEAYDIAVEQPSS